MRYATDLWGKEVFETADNYNFQFLKVLKISRKINSKESYFEMTKISNHRFFEAT